MKTVFDKKEKLKKIVTNYPYNMEDTDTVEFKVMGKTPERTIEDRSVFFEINTNIKGVEDNILHMWLNGEEAIHLGQTLVEQGDQFRPIFSDRNDILSIKALDPKPT